MLALISIGIVAGFLVGFLCIAVAGKLYHLLFCKKKRITSDSHQPEDLQLKQEIRNADAASGWLFCWPKLVHNTNNHNAAVEDPDVELGLGLGLGMKSFVEKGIEAELIRLHNLSGPPRFLFTIKEETLEDLASEDGDCKSTGTRLIDLMRAAAAASPIKKKLPVSPEFHSNEFVHNPLFECSAEAELNRLMPSPPSKFKFLRDAEEKLMKKLEEEREQQ